MTRFYSLHFAFSLILLTVTEIFFYTNRKNRINLKRHHVAVFILMLVATAIIFPAESGTRANPEVTPLPILSDWYFLALYQLLKYMDPYWATIWTLAIPFVTIALTFLDWGPERDMWKRPIFTVIGIMAAIEFILFSLLIIANVANIETDPPFWFAHLIISITIGQFWHWSKYHQRLPMLVWVGFNIAISTFYLFFWHVVTGDYLMVWLQSFVGGESLNNPMNFVWSLLWVIYALLQALVMAVLFWRATADDSIESIPNGETL